MENIPENFELFQGYQGATSSSNLFLAFMDDLILHLKTKCTAEIIIGDFHSLLHAYDTVLLSTSPQTFVNKWKEMVRFFSEKKLSSNIGKSRFMITGSLTTLKGN